MDVDSAATSSTPAPAPTPAPAKAKKEPTEIGAEVDVYFRLLVTLVLIDTKQLDQVSRRLPTHRDSCCFGCLVQAALASCAIQRCQSSKLWLTFVLCSPLSLSGCHALAIYG